MMRTIFLVFVAAVTVLPGCSGGGSSVPAPPRQNLQSLLSQSLNRVPPPGTRVYEDQAITVTDGDRQVSFPSGAYAVRTARALTVQYDGRIYVFSASAHVTQKGTSLKYFIPPRANVPAFLRTRQPSYVVR
jgi:hypothetical protein